MKYKKSVTINLGNYENVKLEVTDAASFDECDQELLHQIDVKGLDATGAIKKALIKQSY